MFQTIKTLLFTGGGVHDFKGCGQVLLDYLNSVSAFEVTHIEDDLDFWLTPEFRSYDVMVFYWTVGELSDTHKNALFNWVSSGKGFVGVHGATASFKQSDDFRSFIGGYLTGHPMYRPYMVSILDKEHYITQGFSEFFVTDEQYLTSYDSRVNILATSLYQGKPHPVMWTKSFGKGRLYYNALGHDPAACSDPNFNELLKRGIIWATEKD